MAKLRVLGRHGEGREAQTAGASPRGMGQGMGLGTGLSTGSHTRIRWRLKVGWPQCPVGHPDH